MTNQKSKLQELADQGAKQSVRASKKSDFKTALKASMLIHIGKKIFPRILLIVPLGFAITSLVATFQGYYITPDGYTDRPFSIFGIIIGLSILFWPLGWIEALVLQTTGRTHDALTRLEERKRKAEERSMRRKMNWNASGIAYIIRPTLFRLTFLVMYLIAWLGVTNQTGNYYKYFQVKEPFEYYYYFKGKGGGGRGEYRTFDPQKEGYAILNASVAMTVPLVLLIILVPVAALQGRRNVKRERERLKSLGIISAGYPEALGLETRHLALDVLIVYKDKMPDSDTMRLAARGLYRKSIHKREHRSDRFELPVYSEKYEIYITRMYKVYRFVHRMVTTINAEYPIERISVTKKE